MLDRQILINIPDLVTKPERKQKIETDLFDF